MSDNTYILYIDDNMDHLAIVQAMLQRKGYICETALTAESGIEMALDKAFDVIIFDIQMPKMSGIEILNQLKRRQQEIGFKTIALTADSTVFAKKNPYDLGFDGFISKPIVSSDLYRVMDEVLAKNTTE